jgi:hypothetical protein
LRIETTQGPLKILIRFSIVEERIPNDPGMSAVMPKLPRLEDLFFLCDKELFPQSNLFSQ